MHAASVPTGGGAGSGTRHDARRVRAVAAPKKKPRRSGVSGHPNWRIRKGSLRVVARSSLRGLAAAAEATSGEHRRSDQPGSGRNGHGSDAHVGLGVDNAGERRRVLQGPAVIDTVIKHIDEGVIAGRSTTQDLEAERERIEVAGRVVEPGGAVTQNAEGYGIGVDDGQRGDEVERVPRRVRSRRTRRRGRRGSPPQSSRT